MDRDRGDNDDDDDGVPLFGDIYTKCATFFSEIDKDIDHIISLGEESFEYAGNKLQIAGSNAKEVCSKFIQENLPQLFPSSSPSSLDENGCYNAPVVVTKNDQHNANGHMSDSSSTQGYTPDNACVKAIDPESPNVPKGTKIGAVDLVGAKDIMNNKSNETEDCDKGNSEESEIELDDVDESDEISNSKKEEEEAEYI